MSETSPAPKTRVLLVEDDSSQRRGYRRALQAAGFDVVEAEDGAVARRQLEASAFDVVLSDITMPNMGGVDLLRVVRERDLDLPVILMTGDPTVQTAIDAMDFGALRYLVKPVDLDQLRDALFEAERLHRMAKLKRQALALAGDDTKQLGDRASLEGRFEAALRSLWMAFQPIVSLRRRGLHAYEALLRSEEETLPSPGAVLSAAERLGRVADVGRTVRALVADLITDAPAELVFVNLHASDLLDDALYDPRAPLSRHAGRVVLEITERAALDDPSQLQTRTRSLRMLGYRLAIDDLGAGYAGLTTFAHLQPDVVKLDMALIRDIERSTIKQQIVRTMRELLHDLKRDVVCEGVETASERDTLARLGCDLLQGYLFARPARGFPLPRPEALP